MGQVFEIRNSPNVHRIRMAQFESGKKVRAANNTREAALVALQEFSRSLGNQMAMEGAGKEYNAASEGLASAMDARTLGQANTAMRAAEMQGALAAQAGALGVGGSSVDFLAETARLQTAVEEAMYDEQTKQYSYRMSKTNANILDRAVGQIDNSQYFASIDHTIDVRPRALKNRWGAILGMAVATFFGGPQAGQAAGDATLASWNASNLNYTAAAQYSASAAQNAMAGFNNWQNARKAGYNSWAQQVWGSNNTQAPQPNYGSAANFGSESGSWFKQDGVATGSSSALGSGWGWGWGG